MAEEFKAITTQEEFDAAIKTRLERERSKYADYDDLKTQLKKLQEEKATYEKTAKESGENQKGLQAQLDEALKKVKTYELDEIKTSVAIEKGLPLELRSRLTGSNEEEIKADAEKLSKIFGESNRSNLPGFTPNEGVGEDEKKTAGYKALLKGLNIKQA